MVRGRQSRAWSRLAGRVPLGFVLAFGLALVVAPAAAGGGPDQATPGRGLVQTVPVTTHAVVAVLRAAPSAASTTAKHLGSDWAATAPAALATLLLGWTTLRRHRPLALATAAGRGYAARAPPSTVGS